MKNIQHTMINQTQHHIRPISVSSLNLAAKDLLESNFSHIWIEGEISNLSQPGSGHAYFSLKDANSQINCAFFRQYQKSNTPLKNGQLIHAKAKLSIYAPRGSYQLLIYQVMDAGKGLLEKAFNELKEKLSKEGLFSPERKKPLPRHPKTIGVVTSKTSAALQDVLAVLERRYPIAAIEVYDCQVQGELAANSICKALTLAQKRQTADVLIVCRGGGSLEDLWPFNEEVVARKIAACSIPTISGVGHEIDTTISDLVADKRTPTPSAAAESCSPDMIELMQKFDTIARQLAIIFERHILKQQNKLEQLSQRLIHPAAKISNLTLQFDSLMARLKHCMANSIENKQRAVEQNYQNMAWRINTRMEQAPIILNRTWEKLQQALEKKIYHSEDCLGNLSARIDLLSPLSTLNRGYTITTDAQGRAITSISKLPSSQIVTITWSDGKKDFSAIES